MLYRKRILLYVLTVTAIFVCLSTAGALAQSTNQTATTASIIGQVTVNGVATNGVAVTCGPGSATTQAYQDQNGVYIISGLPYGVSMPFTASYQGKVYTDTVEPLSTGEQYYKIPTVDINTTSTSATPTPVPNATVTPVPNATATPAPNATVTPTPNATATPAPNSTITPTPVPATPTPAPAAPVPATPVPMTVTATPVPVTPTPVPVTPTPGPITTPEPSLPPTPTKTSSPGFEGLPVIISVIAVAYMLLKKKR